MSKGWEERQCLALESIAKSLEILSKCVYVEIWSDKEGKEQEFSVFKILPQK